MEERNVAEWRCWECRQRFSLLFSGHVPSNIAEVTITYIALEPECDGDGDTDSSVFSTSTHSFFPSTFSIIFFLVERCLTYYANQIFLRNDDIDTILLALPVRPRTEPCTIVNSKSRV